VPCLNCTASPLCAPCAAPAPRPLLTRLRWPLQALPRRPATRRTALRRRSPSLQPDQHHRLLLVAPTRRFPAGRRPSFPCYLLPHAPRCPCHCPSSARGRHACTPAASTSYRSLCPLFNLKRILELPIHFLLRSRTHIFTAISIPDHCAPLDLLRSFCSPSTAPTAASHPQSSAPRALPRPTGAP
jgi:hypothetical protein